MLPVADVSEASAGMSSQQFQYRRSSRCGSALVPCAVLLERFDALQFVIALQMVTISGTNRRHFAK